MPKRSSKPKKKKNPSDINLLAAQIVGAATGQPDEPTDKTQPEKNPAAVALGRLGGLKGGKARAEKLSPKKRSEIAKKAAESRWKKYGK
ncbi:MAG: hypothetical protein KC643_15750 [Nitrospira sp.]|nr:hypothetical protein [Nitrospira sp.]